MNRIALIDLLGNQLELEVQVVEQSPLSYFHDAVFGYYSKYIIHN